MTKSECRTGISGRLSVVRTSGLIRPAFAKATAGKHSSFERGGRGAIAIATAGQIAIAIAVGIAGARGKLVRPCYPDAMCAPANEFAGGALRRSSFAFEPQVDELI
jgi:hypothetical protein